MESTIKAEEEQRRMADAQRRHDRDRARRMQRYALINSAQSYSQAYRIPRMEIRSEPQWVGKATENLPSKPERGDVTGQKL